MKYQIVASNKVTIIGGLSYKEATNNLIMITRMIKAGIKTQYDIEDFSIVEEK